MKAKRYLVTGGTGFIGSALVKKLVHSGHEVTILDDNSRGSPHRITEVLDRVRLIQGDVRNPHDVHRAAAGMHGVVHLAYINGTEYFYSKPELVLEVGVKGIVNVLDACLAHHIPELVLASSSEVYQTPAQVPTPEEAPLVVPDPFNPRYSYGGGKIISELMAIHYGRRYFDRVLIFRPHNVFGPDMGWEHVIPQFSLRMAKLSRDHSGSIPFPIQGNGNESRSFICIDDFAEGWMTILEKGAHLGIYHIGTSEEIPISSLAQKVAKVFGREIQIMPGPLLKGGTVRRCPDITKLSALGFAPKFTFDQALAPVVHWYDDNRHLAEKGTQ
jgi:nucleoside-diphosphate-sugar epimerase